MSAQQAARSRQAESIRLARQRVLDQLAASPATGHLKLLQTALADLDEKLQRLEEH
jgi:hypothetical protein